MNKTEGDYHGTLSFGFRHGPNYETSRGTTYLLMCYLYVKNNNEADFLQTLHPVGHLSAAQNIQQMSWCRIILYS